MVYQEFFEDRHDALSREWHIKRMSRAEKEKLIRPDAEAGPDSGSVPDSGSGVDSV
jgi:predicted GIY-YIG superfamily endonuclease